MTRCLSSPARLRGSVPRSRAGPRGAAGIVACGRDRERGEAVRDDLEATGCAAVFVTADLADPDACVEVIRTADERFGRLDGLVNAAGLSTRGTLDDTSVELW